MSQLTDYTRLAIDPNQKMIDLAEDFSKFIGLESISRYICRPTSLVLKRVDKSTHQSLINDVNKKLTSYIEPSGKDYHKKWEDGWSENLSEFCRTGNISSLYPFYIKKNKYFRISNDYFTSENDYFEVDFAKVIINYFFEKYFAKSKTIIDLGSGSNHYVIDLSLRNSNQDFFALDWSKNSGKIINEANKRFSIDIKPVYFDMFEPFDQKFKSKKSTSVYTVGSLEQLGKSYEKILSWFLKSDFDYIMNIEPIYEFYDLNDPYDLVAAKYIEKRNWLKGYYSSLVSLEKAREIKILERFRSFGSLYHETYNFIIWQKI